MDVVSAPPDVWSIASRLFIATLLGAAIGLNREMYLKPAGMRTHALVSLGSALATISAMLLTEGGTGDQSAPSRVIQGLVAGIGFIGGGVILHRKDNNTVQGLSTAASIWIVSSAGIAAGAGLWRAASIGVALALLVLASGGWVDRLVHGSDISDPN
jgi:putative Mg2+ transporter-C (MgtC) family protein